jgi:hypothetical protein
MGRRRNGSPWFREAWEEYSGARRSAEVRSCEEAAEEALTKALEERLPRHAAPLALKRRLAVQWPMPSSGLCGALGREYGEMRGRHGL